MLKGRYHDEVKPTKALHWAYGPGEGRFPRIRVKVRYCQRGPSGGGWSCQEEPAASAQVPVNSVTASNSTQGYKNNLSLGTEILISHSFVNLFPPLHKNHLSSSSSTLAQTHSQKGGEPSEVERGPCEALLKVGCN